MSPTPRPDDSNFPIAVAALYRFTTFVDCAALRHAVLAECRSAGVRGTVLLATEGINGTIAGSDEGIDRVLASLRALPGCADLDVKRSRARAMPFHRLKVRIKREIVTMGEPGIDAAAGAGRYVAPADWNALIEQPGTIVIDTRNDFEVAIGSFAGAIDPGLQSFRDFPAWFRDNQDALRSGDHPPRVAMFCTGGIRCEKATAFVRSQGVADVYHLQGGILAYLEAIPADESRWRGECFVFDQRVALGHALAPGNHDTCHACRRPVSAQDRASPLYSEGASCPACHAVRTEEQRASYAERHRQSRLAEARGTAHVGATYPPTEDRLGSVG